MRFSANVSTLFKEVYVGIEYNLQAETAGESLGWLPGDLRGGDVSVSNLRLQEGERHG